MTDCCTYGCTGTGANCPARIEPIDCPRAALHAANRDVFPDPQCTIPVYTLNREGWDVKYSGIAVNTGTWSTTRIQWENHYRQLEERPIRGSRKAAFVMSASDPVNEPYSTLDWWLSRAMWLASAVAAVGVVVALVAFFA